MHKARSDKPVSALLVELLRQIDGAASELSLSYFVAGAFARDLLLVHVYGFDVPRPTRDVDIGVAVASWDEFERVKARLIATRQFSPDNGIAHRLRFGAASGSHGVPLDIVPFAGVEEPSGVLTWPPDRAVVMNVMGFKEALTRREEVEIAENVVVPVASLPAQTLLKLAAWLDRRRETPKDAIDLLVLFRRYGDAGNEERLYDEKVDLLANAEFDVERAGATLLGEDVRNIAMSSSFERLNNAFVSPDIQNAFVTHVSSGVAVIEGDRVSRAETLVNAFFTGLGTTKGS